MQYDKDSEKVTKKVANYREIYERETGEPVPNGFHVHHIDGDRRNNHILNLVAIPHNLHNAYHFAGGQNVGKRFNFLIQDSNEVRLSMFSRNALLRIFKIIDECAQYVDRRDEILRKKGAAK